jgi:uncharacterized protein (DUF1810 family)
MGFDLDRFVTAQDFVYERVRQELAEGRKRTHWMWFIFPQVSGLGHSARAQRYGIVSLDEAAAYLKHPILGPRLLQCTDIVNGLDGRSIDAIFGSPDDQKFQSCMTLFAEVPEAPEAFHEALVKYFRGAQDLRTLEQLKTAG